MTSDCSAILPENGDIFLESAPLFKIKVRKNNRNGFNFAICLECQLEGKSGGQKFRNYPIVIVGKPDCSDALESKKAKAIPEISYNEKI